MQFPRLKTLFLWLLQASKGHRVNICITSFLGAGYAILGLAFIWFTKGLIDAATGDSSSTIAYESMLLAGVFVAQIVVGVLNMWVSTRISVLASNRLRRELFSKVMRSLWSANREMHTGDAVNRISSDTTSVVNLLTGSMPALTTAVIQLSFAFYFFYYFDARLALTILIVIPLFVFMGRIYIKRMRVYTRKIRESDSKIQSKIQESIEHRTVINTLENTAQSISQLSYLQGTMLKQVLERTRFSIRSRIMISLGFGGSYLIAFVWGATQLSEGLITYGMLTAFLLLVSQIQSPIYSISKLIPGMTAALTSAERLIALEQLPQEEAGEAILLPATPELRMESVSFSYNDKRGLQQVLDGVNYTFPAGSTTAILGETGAGKTTLIRLLLALVAPESGSITLREEGGKTSIPVSPLTRSNFVYVPQGNSLFSGTIRENLLMGNPDSTDEQMITALAIAEAGFAMELENQLDTVLGEGGMGLSEGQAQRISIARSLLRPGHIMLFDEATSALDTDTEQRLFNNLQKEYKGNKTLIFITHHPQLASLCNQTITIA